MDIYITGKDPGGVSKKITIPIIPDSINYSSEARFNEYEVINLGQVFVPDGKNLFDLSWDGIFPGEAMEDSSVVRKYTDPYELDELFKYWRENGTSLNVCITDTNINADVYISEYSSVLENVNISYSVTFVELEKITVSATKKASSESQTVTVKKGDTLQSLAKKYLGSKSEYKKIYKKNKSTIDKRNKKEQKKAPNKKISKYTIYKGQTLVIPSTSATVVENERVKDLKTAINKDGYANLTVNKKLNSAMKTAMKKITIKKGGKGQVVKFVQGIVGTSQTGNYKEKDVKAVKSYQRKKSLTVDGVIAYKTLLKMIS